MRTEPPGDLLRRLLPADSTDTTADPGGDTGPNPDPGGDQRNDPAEDDPNSLVPRWLPDGTADTGWLAKVRADPGRAGVVALAVVAGLAVLITVFTVVRDHHQPVVSAKIPAVEMVSAAGPDPAAGRGGTAEPGRGADTADTVVVSVVGLVHRQGLVTLSPGARVADALDAAGGVLDGADTVGLNMARPLDDGEQIVVGLTTPPGQPPTLGSSVTGGRTAADGPSTAPVDAPADSGPINLNTATVAQLDTLPGVGPVTAAAIVAWRTGHGKFTSVDQLGEVDGIGPARLEKLRPLVRV